VVIEAQQTLFNEGKYRPLIALQIPFAFNLADRIARQLRSNFLVEWTAS
jgi:hypothetical protein